MPGSASNDLVLAELRKGHSWISENPQLGGSSPDKGVSISNTSRGKRQQAGIIRSKANKMSHQEVLDLQCFFLFFPFFFALLIPSNSSVNKKASRNRND